MNSITSEIFKKKEVRQCQKRGKDKVWGDFRRRSDPICWALGVLGGENERSYRPGDPKSGPLQRVGLTKGVNG